MNLPVPGRKYRHLKSGTIYACLATGRVCPDDQPTADFVDCDLLYVAAWEADLSPVIAFLVHPSRFVFFRRLRIATPESVSRLPLPSADSWPWAFLYQNLDNGQHWVRPASDFTPERYEEVAA